MAHSSQWKSSWPSGYLYLEFFGTPIMDSDGYSIKVVLSTCRIFPKKRILNQSSFATFVTITLLTTFQSTISNPKLLLWILQAASGNVNYSPCATSAKKPVLMDRSTISASMSQLSLFS